MKNPTKFIIFLLSCLLLFSCKKQSASETESVPAIDSGDIYGKMKRFPPKGYGGWLHIDYPAAFKTDPRSLQGEEKWWARFVSPTNDLTIDIDSYGCISHSEMEDDVHAVGPRYASPYKSPAEFFKSKILENPATFSNHPGYEVYVEEKRNGVYAYFLSKEAYDPDKRGICYQQITFAFNRHDYSKLKKLINHIIASAKPSFSEE
jgi:hypothetical protein